MAIAPFEETGAPTTRGTSPTLRVIRGGRRTGAAPRRAARHAAPATHEVPRESRDSHPSAQRAVAKPGAQPVGRVARATPARGAAAHTLVRPVGASVAVRRRRAAGIAVSLAAVVLLALPIRALGAVTVAGQDTPAGVPAGLAPGSTIVVQSGDTIHSVAMRVNPGDAAQIARALVAEVGSTTLVPGEHVVIP